MYDHAFAGSVDSWELRDGELAASVGQLALSDGRTISGPPVNLGRLACLCNLSSMLWVSCTSLGSQALLVSGIAARVASPFFTLGGTLLGFVC